MLSVFGFILEIIRIDSAFCEKNKLILEEILFGIWSAVRKLDFASKSWFDYE
jgi:hypothetical protein